MGKTFKDRKRYLEDYDEREIRKKKKEHKEKRKRSEQQVIDDMLESGNIGI
jgi:hypothetical protein